MHATHPHVDSRTLRTAIDDMRTAVVELVDPTTRGVLRDDGTVTRHHVPSLLDQLRAEQGHGGDHGAGGGSGCRLPVVPDILDLIATIELGIRYLAADNGIPATSDPQQTLHRVVNVVGASTDLDTITWTTRCVRSWTTSINALLDPPRRYHVAAACPACDTRMVRRTDEHTGEATLTPALTVDGTTGCHCLECGHTWPPAMLEHLALVLGCPPIGVDNGT